MAVHCFTSFSFSYLAKARVLAASIKKHHPEWRLWAVICDREPLGFSFDIEAEQFDEVIWIDRLFGDETPAWLFKHDIVELCTAVKGPILKYLCGKENVEKVFYLDPDTAVFNSLEPLVEMLDHASIILTPHQLRPDSSQIGILDNEVSSLRYGTYNLGFVGISNNLEGRSFAAWWAERCTHYCYDDLQIGLFVDQKWCDLVPAFFDNVRIVRDPGYNVASWNLSTRRISIEEKGQILVNGTPLRFFHFTKLGPIGDVMTRRYAKDNVDVYELWAWYKRQVDGYAEPRIPPNWWKYGEFSNTRKIRKEHRALYRQREDLQVEYRDPFNVYGKSLYSWLQQEGMLTAED